MTDVDLPKTPLGGVPTGTPEPKQKVDSVASPKTAVQAPPPAMSIAEFLQHCSTFITQHRIFAVAVCAVISAVAVGGFAVGQWKSTDAATQPGEDLSDVSKNLAVLSETAQSNFDRQSYFFETLTELLKKKGLIDSPDAQRLLTGVIVFEFRDEGGKPESKAYERFIEKMRPKYRVTLKGYSNQNLQRGIVLSIELDRSILCEFVRAAFDSRLGLTFVERAKVPPQNNFDRYSIQINAEPSDVPEKVVLEIDEAREDCKL
jgi:hypothetical protein